MMMGSGRKALWALLLSVVFLCFLMFVCLSGRDSNTNTIIPSRRSLKFSKNVQPEKRGVLPPPPHHHLSFVSKRRVPNGPDPIHNKRIGDSRLPPT